MKNTTNRIATIGTLTMKFYVYDETSTGGRVIDAESNIIAKGNREAMKALQAKLNAL